MPRPRIHKKPTKLNLSVDLEIKRKAYALATVRGVSVSALLTALVEDAARQPS